MRAIKTFILLFLLCLVQSCKINQTNHHEKVGKWIFKTELENKNKNIVRGRYNNNGWQKGTWRYRLNGKLYKKEQYKEGVATVTFYHPNGKIAQKGHTKIDTINGLHYYYFSSWFIYDNEGNLMQVKHYDKGILKHETQVKK